MTRFIIIFLFLTMAVALFFGQSRSYFSDITALKTEKQTLDEALAHSAESQKLKNQLLSQYNAISQGDIGRLGKLMPSQTDSGSLIIMLEDRVKAHGLLLKKIDVSNVKQSEESLSSVLGTVLPYESINLSFSISGPYDSILELLADLEASLRVIDVNNIGFSSGATDFYEFNISAKT
jgi:Tfp pilus assembly protein PilO